jgi:hypothetical protein
MVDPAGPPPITSTSQSCGGDREAGEEACKAANRRAGVDAI